MKKLATTTVLGIAGILMSGVLAQEPGATSIQTIVTVEARHDHDKNVAVLQREDLMAYEGKLKLQVNELVPLTGDRAGLELYFLIDDASGSTFGSQIPDLQRFIERQPATASIGIAYMRNATVSIAQELTTDHLKAAKALRLPFGAFGVMASPYLSLRDLIKRWPGSANRREVIFFSSGADPMGDFGTVNSYLDSAIEEAQREGVIAYAIYNPTTGHRSHSFWRLTWAQNHLAQLGEETGGETFMLGFGPPVSFAPYLEQIAAHLEHQYRAELMISPDAKDSFRHLRFATEVSNTEIVGPDRVYVPGTLNPKKK